MTISAVIDVNLLVRGTLSPKGGSRVLIVAFKRGEYLPITSRRHLTELYQVLGYRRLTRKWPITHRIRRRLIAQLYQRATWVEPTGALRFCRDPKDDYLLEMALLGKATYLVSEDDDLHDDPLIPTFLAQRNVRLVRLDEFLASLREAKQ
jgi:putative PIN family toxin of toxin-antitoxin system